MKETTDKSKDYLTAIILLPDPKLFSEFTKDKYIKGNLIHEMGHILLCKYIMPRIDNKEALVVSFNDNKIKELGITGGVYHNLFKEMGIPENSPHEGFAYWFSDKIMGWKIEKEKLELLIKAGELKKEILEYYQTFESAFDNFPKERLFDSYFIFKMKEIINNS